MFQYTIIIIVVVVVYVCRYWYNNSCLFPDMGTVFIAIDKCDRENGCLKVCRLNGKYLCDVASPYLRC